MSHANAEPEPSLWQPARPNLVATGLLSFWIILLALPMLTGQWLAGPFSDQYSAGYAFRSWEASQFHLTGHIPLWNPTLFGGLPFLGAMHGDMFYPTSFLRLVFPVAAVMNFGFVLHFILAGFFAYLLLRRLGVSWIGSLTGGLAFQLSGLIGSYPGPGHDGKLFATTMLPLGMIALILGIRERRLQGHALLALTVGCAVLGHPQLAYYDLIAWGLFALYLTLADSQGRSPATLAPGLAVALGAVALGMGVAMIQVLPFYRYIPYSPRAEGYRGFEGSASFGIPWSHVPEFFLSNFAGARDTYWGPNGLKLHSEYLGLPVIGLAALGIGTRRRRLALWLGGIGLLFLLICLSNETPFFRIWWTVMPMVKKTRAPGMAFFAVALIVSAFAAFGAERLERKEGRRAALVWIIAGGALTLLALAGGVNALAESLALSVQAMTGFPSLQVAQSARSSIMLGAAGSALALGLAGGLALAWLGGRLRPLILMLGLALVVGGDLFRNAHGFWIYSRADRELFRKDEVTTLLTALPAPSRVLEVPSAPVYPHSALMAFNVASLFGYHGNEIRFFDQLWGGKNIWRNIGSPTLWDLYAINHLLLPTEQIKEDSVPGFNRVLHDVETSAGVRASLFERRVPEPYARVVAGAVKLGDEQAVKALVGAKRFINQIVLLDSSSTLSPAAVGELPAPLSTRATVQEYGAGHMRLALDPAPQAPAYVVIAENFYPDWRASVDGKAVAVERGNVAMLTVPVPAGARIVELRFESADYHKGKTVSLLSLGLVAMGLLAPGLLRRRAHG